MSLLIFTNVWLFLGELDIELKDLLSKFANDVIASSAFGVKVNTLENPENIFYHMARKFTNHNGIAFSLKIIGYMLIPRIMKVLVIIFLFNLY